MNEDIELNTTMIAALITLHLDNISLRAYTEHKNNKANIRTCIIVTNLHSGVYERYKDYKISCERQGIESYLL